MDRVAWPHDHGRSMGRSTATSRLARPLGLPRCLSMNAIICETGGRALRRRLKRCCFVFRPEQNMFMPCVRSRRLPAARGSHVPVLSVFRLSPKARHRVTMRLMSGPGYPANLHPLSLRPDQLQHAVGKHRRPYPSRDGAALTLTPAYDICPQGHFWRRIRF